MSRAEKLLKLFEQVQGQYLTYNDHKVSQRTGLKEANRRWIDLLYSLGSDVAQGSHQKDLQKESIVYKGKEWIVEFTREGKYILNGELKENIDEVKKTMGITETDLKGRFSKVQGVTKNE